ncbi:hypothetical protein [Paenibacillus glacialis]|uniref:Uncharacterized protein n=1 Tax=Paenibacillus glacialis TaxID=494026 RepID=A0A162K907_9BACL|nr:hypothetical protein [Paenibacillus glacialis]OAB44746.1 hypothetical protein PGLA_04855 [Paenibacillus glacialis]
MKVKKLTILMLTAIMLIIFSTTASANTAISRIDTVTGQGELKISGYLYVKTSSSGAIFADVYRVVNGTEQYVTRGSRTISEGPRTANINFNFSINGLSQDTYVVRYSYGGSLSSITITSVGF